MKHIAILIFLTGCVMCYDNKSFIKNETDSAVTLIIQLDTSITRQYSYHSNKYFLLSYSNDSTCKKLFIDTINNIGIYKLNSGAAISVNGGTKEPYTKFKYLEIRSNKDTVRYLNNISIQKAFTADLKPNYHELTIK